MTFQSSDTKCISYKNLLVESYKYQPMLNKYLLTFFQTITDFILIFIKKCCIYTQH